MTVLEVRDLSVSIGDTPVVHDLQLTLNPGDRIGLIGESGSGKTLAALAIMGLLPEGGRATGSAILGDTNLLTLDERRLAQLRGNRIAMVFQEPMTALDPLMTVGQQLTSVIRLHQDVDNAVAHKRAVDLLQQVELPDPDDSMRAHPHQLSGGQRQRVLLAMALANEPEVLICDEPTTALDVTVQRRVLALIERLVTERNTALLFITHDLAVVSNLCDSVLVLYGGRTLELGPIEPVFAQPRNPYTDGLLNASNLADLPPGSPLRTIPGSVPGVGQFPPGCPFRGRCDRELPACVTMPELVVEQDGRGVYCHNPLPRHRDRVSTQ